MAIITRNKPVEQPKLTEALVAETLAMKFDWFRNYIFTNVYFGLYEMDVAIITPAMYLWEIEIKLTRADWLKDEKKRKWNSPGRTKVSRFYYAVPIELVEEIPEFVTTETGIIGIKYHPYNGMYFTEPIRSAVRIDVKITQAEFNDFMKKIYFKYWRRRFRSNSI